MYQERKSIALLLGILALILAYYALSSVVIGRSLANYTVMGENGPFLTLPLKYFVTHFNARSFFAFEQGYPPLYYITAAAVVRTIGKHWTAMVMLNNVFYLATLLLFSYLLGRELKDRVSGIILAVLALLLPMTYEGFLVFCQDFALPGMAMMTVYFLVRSRYFELGRWSVLAGISCGAGMLVKDSFAAYVAGPVMVGMFLSVKDLCRKDPRRALNLALGLLIGAAIMYPVYCRPDSMAIVLNRVFDEPSNNWKIRVLTAGIMESQLSPLFFIMALAGLYFFLKKAETRVIVAVLSWIIVPTLALLFMPHRMSVRYVAGIQPAYAVIIMYLAAEIFSARYGKLLFAGVCGLGLLQHYVFVFEPVRLDRLAVAGIRYFHNHGDEDPGITLAAKQSQSTLMRDIAARIAEKAPFIKRTNGGGRAYTLLWIPQKDYLRGIDFLMNGYFWFNDYNVEMQFYSDYVYPSLAERSVIPGDVDLLLYAAEAGANGPSGESVLTGDTPRPYIPFGMIESNWQLRDTPGARDWSSLVSKWGAFLGRYRYAGVVHRDDRKIIHLFVKNDLPMSDQLIP